MHHPTDMIAHTKAFVTPVVDHWLEQVLRLISNNKRPNPCIVCYLNQNIILNQLNLKFECSDYEHPNTSYLRRMVHVYAVYTLRSPCRPWQIKIALGKSNVIT